MTDTDYITRHETEGRYVDELDVLDPLTVWVDCEQGEHGCSGGDYVAYMVRDGSGWICPSCDWVCQKNWEDEHR